MKLIGITGGIGAGKSVVSQIIKSTGLDVYDSDREAKRLINQSAVIREQLISLFGAEVYLSNGIINKPLLANAIFSNEEMRLRVNSIVHPVVCGDIKEWHNTLSERANRAKFPLCFVESAILFESGIENLTSAVIYVDAPEQIRLARILNRDNTVASEAIKRIESQHEIDSLNRSKSDYIINNDETALLTPQVYDVLVMLH